VQKRYRFRLQAVLDYRTEQMNRMQQKLAIEEHKRMLVVQRLHEYDDLIEDSFRQQQALLGANSFDLNEVRQFPHYVLRLKQSRYQEQLVLQEQERHLRVLREEMKQAMIRKKSLELLKDKGLQTHRFEMEKAEEEALADLVLARHRPG
jgi:flagellar protein FliJ